MVKARIRLSAFAWFLVVGFGLGLGLSIIPGAGRSAAALDERPAVTDLGDQLPAYPGTTLLPWGREVAVDGRRRQMAYATTQVDPTLVVNWYADLWQREGLSVRRFGEGQQLGVSATDPLESEVFSVLAAATDGPTSVVLSRSEKGATTATRLVSVPAGCATIGSTYGDDATGAREVVLITCLLTVEELGAKLEEILGVADFVDGDGASVERWRWQKNGRELNARLRLEAVDPPRVVASIVSEELP